MFSKWMISLLRIQKKLKQKNDVMDIKRPDFCQAFYIVFMF